MDEWKDVSYDPEKNPLSEYFYDMSKMSKTERLKELKRIAKASQASVAKGDSRVVLKFGSDLKGLEFIPTGIADFDALCGTYVDDENGEPAWTGKGGIPLGRFTIWWGAKGSGKTTMALRQVGEAQKQGYVVGYFNSERALDPVWCLKQGVDLDELVVWEGGNLEENMDSMRDILGKNLVDCIVIDTIHAFAAMADTEGAKGKVRGMTKEPPRSPAAKSLSRFFRVVVGAVADAGVGVLVIGQARAGEKFEQLTGGKALEHYNSLTVHFVRINNRDRIPLRKVSSGTEPAGFLLKAISEKTRVNHRETQYVEIPFLFGLGPDVTESNIMAAVKLGIIRQAASYYTLPTSQGEMQIQGRDSLISWIRGNEPYYDWLLQIVTGGFVEPEDRRPPEEVEGSPKVQKETEGKEETKEQKKGKKKSRKKTRKKRKKTEKS